MVRGAEARVVTRQQATVGVCQDVDLQIGLAVVGTNLFDQLVQAGQRGNIVQSPIVQVDVVIPLLGFDRFTRLTS